VLKSLDDWEHLLRRGYLIGLGVQPTLWLQSNKRAKDSLGSKQVPGVSRRNITYVMRCSHEAGSVPSAKGGNRGTTGVTH
jgi:hypothetical protein